MTIEYKPRGVCSRAMTVTVENGIITDVQVQGGCDGNLHGIMSLVKGMKAEDVVARLEGIRCGGKATSCPDQLSRAPSRDGARILGDFAQNLAPEQSCLAFKPWLSRTAALFRTQDNKPRPRAAREQPKNLRSVPVHGEQTAI